MLKVKASYEDGNATIVTEDGAELSREEIVAALKKIGYTVEFEDE